jgi:hypothetical protein
VAVYDRSYRGYDGPITPLTSRWKVLPRFAWAQVFKSRLFVGFFTAVLRMARRRRVLHLSSSQPGSAREYRVGWDPARADQRALFRGVHGHAVFLLRRPADALDRPRLGLAGSRQRRAPALLVAAHQQDGLRDRKDGDPRRLDLADHLGAGLFLFCLQSWLAGWSWFAANFRIGVAIVIGAGSGSSTISLLALAASPSRSGRSSRRRFSRGDHLRDDRGPGDQQMFRTRIGFVFALPELMHTVWEGLFQVPLNAQLTPLVAWLALFGICFVSIGVLARKLKAFEVVK